MHIIVGRRRVRQLGRRLLVQSRAIVDRACHHTAAVMMMMMMMIRASRGLRPLPQQMSSAETTEIVLLATGHSLPLLI